MISKSELKRIKSLKLKKYRAKEGLFLVEGVKNVKELLASDFEVAYVLCTNEYEHVFPDFPATVLSRQQLEAASTLSTNNSCIAVAKVKSFDEDDVNTSDHIIVLDAVRDPGNLGTILRSLDWFGFSQVVCSEDCADFYNPKTIAATMGSFGRVKSIYTDLAKFLASASMTRFALTMDGEPLTTATIRQPSIFVLGSESSGIRTDTLDHTDSRLSIPGSGAAESLNVAMATSILLYALRL